MFMSNMVMGWYGMAMWKCGMFMGDMVMGWYGMVM